MRKNHSERGSALMLVTIIMLILVGISGAYMSISWWSTKRAAQDEAAAQALFIAESGAAEYIVSLNASGVAPTPRGRVGLANGYYWVPAENLVDFSQTAVVGVNNQDNDYASFQVAGRFNGITRRVDVLVTHKAGGVFWNAIFAGNKNSTTGFVDPNYTLDLAGVGSANSNDIVKGDIYVANNINVGGDAMITDPTGSGTGKVTFGNKNTGLTGSNYQQGTEPDLSIPRTFTYTDPSTGLTTTGLTEAEFKAKTYNGNREPLSGNPAAGIPDTAWVDVDSQFQKNGTANHKWADGSVGTDILDPKNPAHFLRKNPGSTGGATNRTATYEHAIDTTTIGPAGNKRNDYYIEDPVKLDGTTNNVTDPSLTGHSVNGDTSASMVNIGKESNNAVFVINGNLRVSGEPIKSYQFNPGTGVGDIKMTFIVKGNASFTDNILYPNWESQTDAIAIIAIKDPAYPNTSAADFAAYSGTTPLTPNGVSIDTFITQYNSRASASGGNMVPLDLKNNPGDIARASQEYNKLYGSGNIFFGDPGSGTVEHFESFMYAENNFYATNLDATTSSGGTQKVEIYGNMTAGNQVSMDRNPLKANFGRVPLHVTFDPIITTGKAPPGLPVTPGVAGVDWHIVSWKQSTNTAEPNNANEK